MFDLFQQRLLEIKGDKSWNEVVVFLGYNGEDKKEHVSADIRKVFRGSLPTVPNIILCRSLFTDEEFVEILDYKVRDGVSDKFMKMYDNFFDANPELKKIRSNIRKMKRKAWLEIAYKEGV
ncbi:TPA: hypothetical protein ACGO11_000531 [Streptococcus suis]